MSNRYRSVKKYSNVEVGFDCNCNVTNYANKMVFFYHSCSNGSIKLNY
jgi:hypothetical protein